MISPAAGMGPQLIFRGSKCGIVFAELQKYAETKHGARTWQQVLTKSGLASKLYFPVQEYPDSEIASLVRATSEMTGQPTLALLEDFGQFIVPSLLRMYGHLLKPGWKSIDVIEHTEGTVHTVVRVQNPGAKPPQLKSQRLSDSEVLRFTASNVCPGNRNRQRSGSAFWGEHHHQGNDLYAQRGQPLRNFIP